MANNRSPAAREFLRGCHKNDIVVVDKYIQGRIDVDIIFLGMMEAVRHKSGAAFHVLFDFALVKFKTHPQRFQETSDNILDEIVYLSTPTCSQNVCAVVKKILPYCSYPKISRAMYCAVEKNKNDIFEQLLPKFHRHQVSYEKLFYISLDNNNSHIQEMLFDRIDVSKMWEYVWKIHNYEYNGNKHKTQSNIDRLEEVVVNKNLTNILQSFEDSEEKPIARRKI